MRLPTSPHVRMLGGKVRSLSSLPTSVHHGQLELSRVEDRDEQGRVSHPGHREGSVRSLGSQRIPDMRDPKDGCVEHNLGSSLQTTLAKPFQSPTPLFTLGILPLRLEELEQAPEHGVSAVKGPWVKGGIRPEVCPERKEMSDLVLDVLHINSFRHSQILLRGQVGAVLERLF